ncbi:MAG: hypothetical protein Q7S22_00060 [Candidatus Micrarchaeota archaeon]|nr:hypothetical protein [Candidatus Micrarchaeota archaeon]
MNATITTNIPATRLTTSRGSVTPVTIAQPDRIGLRFIPTTLSQARIALVCLDGNEPEKILYALREKTAGSNVIDISYKRKDLTVDMSKVLTDLKTTKPHIVLIPFCKNREVETEMLIKEIRRAMPLTRIVTFSIDYTGETAKLGDLARDSWSVQTNGDTGDILTRELDELLVNTQKKIEETLARSKVLIFKPVNGTEIIEDRFTNELFKAGGNITADVRVLTTSSIGNLETEIRDFDALVITCIPHGIGNYVAATVANIRATRPYLPIVIIGNDELRGIITPVMKMDRREASHEMIFGAISLAVMV